MFTIPYLDFLNAAPKLKNKSKKLVYWKKKNGIALKRYDMYNDNTDAIDAISIKFVQ